MKCLFCQCNNIACIHSAGANKRAFTAEHTFSYDLANLPVFPSFDQDVNLPQAEAGEIAACTCCSAASAFDTPQERRFPVSNIISNTPVIRIIIDLSPF